MAETILKLENVVKVFGKTRAVDGSSFEVAKGEFFTLLGPSGCGKTTTLRLVAGLETARRRRDLPGRPAGCRPVSADCSFHRISATWAWSSRATPSGRT